MRLKRILLHMYVFEPTLQALFGPRDRELVSLDLIAQIIGS